jgi:SAM-dependent methyltransferase
MDCHEYQRQTCGHTPKPILNLACKEDPANLGKLLNTINLDKYTFDPHTNIHAKDVPNFVQGDALRLPFDRRTFGTIVIGELLEHCEFYIAEKILKEARRALAFYGRVILTFPLDSRPPTEQHDAHKLVQWAPGITSWHQTIWTDAKLEWLLMKSRLRIVKRRALDYPFLRDQTPQGWGMVLARSKPR